MWITWCARALHTPRALQATREPERTGHGSGDRQRGHQARRVLLRAAQSPKHWQGQRDDRKLCDLDSDVEAREHRDEPRFARPDFAESVREAEPVNESKR